MSRTGQRTSKSRSVQKPVRSAYIISEVGAEIHQLADILHRLGVRTFNAEALNASSVSLAAATQDAIAQAGLVCAILKPTNSPYVYLELGYAMALGRPIILIGGPSTQPDFLADLLWIKAPIDDTKAFPFQLKAALDNIGAFRPRAARGRVSPAPSKESSSKVKGPVTLASELERLLLTALENSAEIASIVTRSENAADTSYIPDLAVWLAHPVPESPMIIEIKGHLGSGGLRQATEQLLAYARNGEAKSALLIHCEPRDADVVVLTLSPLTFALGVDHAITLLAEGRLLEALRLARNRFAHLAG